MKIKADSHESIVRNFDKIQINLFSLLVRFYIYIKLQNQKVKQGFKAIVRFSTLINLALFSTKLHIQPLFLIFFILILQIFTKIYLYSQLRLDNWTTYTSLWDTRSSSIDAKGKLWFGTSGGAYSYNLKDSSIKEFRNINALHSLDISSLGCNIEYNAIYFGSTNGTIDIFTGDSLWLAILDIKNSNFVNKIIKDIQFRDKKVYIGGGFGLTVFDHNQKVFIEDALKFGDFQPNAFVNKIAIRNNEIWVATEEGIARAYLDSSISPKDSWTTFSTKNGLPEKAVKDIVVSGNDIFALCQNKIYKLTDTLFTLVYEGYFTDIASDGNILYYATDNQVFSSTDGLIALEHQDLITGINVVKSYGKNIIIVYYKEYGVNIISDSMKRFILPNTPAYNQFKAMSIGYDGKFWACSDGQSGGRGLTTFDGKKWSNIIGKFYPEFNDALQAVWTITDHPDGRIISGTWGKGLLVVQSNDTGYTLKSYNETNGPFLSELGEGGKYIVIGETAVDNEGTIWIVQQSGVAQLLISLDKDGKFTPFVNQTNIENKVYNRIAIDNYGTKWLGAWSNTLGMYYFNEKYVPNKFGTLTTSNSGLCNNEQNSIAVDKNNIIWIGTETGLCFIRNPEAALSNDKFFIAEMTAFRNIKINDIMVDALNNKWLATNDGIWVLGPDGDIITKNNKPITMDNSPLLTNEILSLTTNPMNGLIYIGTRQGLTIVTSLSIEPLETFNLECYPQPFKPERDRDLVIDGLAFDSDVRITTTEGRLVRNISGFGRTIFWDGKDNSGNYVSSGIYIINANSLTTGETALAKVAIIRD